MKQIVVAENSFVYRWFAWSLKVLDTLNDEPRKVDYLTTGTNLCHMMRILLFWAPLAIAFEMALVVAAAYVFVILPIQELGVRVWAIDVGLRVGIGGILALVIWFCSATRVDTPKAVSDGITLGRLFTEAVMAQKRKICPFITFTRRAQ